MAVYVKLWLRQYGQHVGPGGGSLPCHALWQRESILSDQSAIRHRRGRALRTPRSTRQTHRRGLSPASQFALFDVLMKLRKHHFWLVAGANILMAKPPRPKKPDKQR